MSSGASGSSVFWNRFDSLSLPLCSLDSALVLLFQRIIAMYYPFDRQLIGNPNEILT